MRQAVAIEQTAINTNLRKATEDLKHLNHVRDLARSITEEKINSIDGQPEVANFLRLKDYPNAPAETAAKLLGIERDFFRYQNALIGLSNLERFEILESGKASLKPSHIEHIKDENTQYFEGKHLEVYLAVEKACNGIKAANKVIGSGVAIKLMRLDHEGNPEPNIPAIMELVGR